ncbi:hypothetical protein PHYPSEUDO_015397 [Phytophthora pseudosyringae]|uniref:RxLR effector PexRD54 WY domain-containing protein n=1 Tax=Phytophthora pseudosyringae TaxID=221518 RepID=A0A8T1V6K7_9STRA|nr:hypothetical protein PHYPSEUDO_015397 [Phytophthora pseudosyringae]
MRLHNAVLLAAASLLLASTTAESPFNTGLSTSLRISDQHDAPAKRLRRTHATSKTEQDNEERGVTTSGVESLANSLKAKINTEQLETWLKGGHSTDDVFKLLTLDNAADDLLANPQLQAWVNYMKLFNKENPKKQTTLIKTLTSHYGDEGLAKIIETAKQASSTAAIAKRLQTEQIQRWLVQEKSPDDVFTLMKLDKAGDQLFQQPQVVTWAKYVVDFNKAHPGQKKTLFSAVTKFDDQTLVNMLIAAKNVPSTEKIAVRVQADLTNAWLKIKKTPNDVFTLLRLKKDAGTLLDDPSFIAWMKYTDDYNLMYPKETMPVIYTMAKQYPIAQLATMLVKAHKVSSTAKLASQLHLDLLEHWFKNGNAPSYVFKLLKLDKTEENLLDSPVFNSWLKYVAYFRRENPKQKVNTISILKDHYKDDVLAKMLVEARRVPATETIAINLLDSLTFRWMHNKKSPTLVYTWLRVGGTPEDDVIRKIYKTYDELYNMRHPY